MSGPLLGSKRGQIKKRRQGSRRHASINAFFQQATYSGNESNSFKLKKGKLPHEGGQNNDR